MQNVNDIKVQNTFKIIDAIRFNHGRTKKEIASDTGLSFATVSNICRELREKKLILEIPVDKSDLGVGRLPNAIVLNHKEFFGLCIDMHNGDRMVLAITNLRNEIVIRKEISLKEHDRLTDILVLCNQVCTQACEEVGIDRKSLLKLCVAVPAVYGNKTRLVVASSIPIFEGQPLKAMLEEIFDLPVFVGNEANLSSMSVILNNNLGMKNTKNLVYIFCSEGLGLGVIADGKQLVGCDGYAAEICHIPIGNQKLLCERCGVAGCVESDLILSGFITKYFDYAPWNHKKTFDYWGEFLAAVASGEKKALDVVHENAKILGKLTSLLVNLFDPEIVCIGGSVSVLFERMKPIIEAEVTSRLIGRAESRALLLQDSDENTIIYGCAEIIYNRMNFSAL